jgi:biotin carboxylase
MQLTKSMPKKSLLVLAASHYQLDIIRTAKRLGYRVITTDNQPSNPGHALADQSYLVSTTDQDAVLELARAERIDGVVAACSDVAVPTAAHVAEALQLPGPSVHCASIVTNKITFRRFLRERGLPVPRSHVVDANTRFEASVFDAQRWIIKPDDSSGSKGVFIISSPGEFVERLPEALRFSSTGHAILEQFIDGAQGTCEGFLYDGAIALNCILDRQTAPAPYVTTCGHHVPTRLPASAQAALLAQLAEIWAALGVSTGPFDCDFVVDGERVYLLEISPRIGGNAIADLLRKAIDFDIVEASVKLACGDLTGAPRAQAAKPTAVVLLGVFSQGRLSYDCAAVEALRGESWVHALTLDKSVGEAVQPFMNGRHRVGDAIVVGADRDELDQRVAQLKTRLRLRAA